RHGAAELCLDHRSKQAAEKQRRSIELKHPQHYADQAEEHQDVDVEYGVGHRVDADADKRYHHRIEQVVGHAQQTDPQADERHVEDDEQDVADHEGSDQTPDKIGVLRDYLRSGDDPVHHHHAQHHRHHGIARNTKRHGGDERGLDGGVAGALRRGNAGNCTLSELLGGFAETLFQ